MKHLSRLVLTIALIGILVAPAMALDPLGDMLVSLDKQARSDLIKFNKTLSSTFGIPVPDVEKLLKILPSPGDVYMALRVGEVANVPVDRVVAEFKNNPGQGWGVIAKRMGIKPGSAEFHALKQGKLKGYSVEASTGGGGKSKGAKGKSHKGKGKNK